jgi:hypothetical protein
VAELEEVTDVPNPEVAAIVLVAIVERPWRRTRLPKSRRSGTLRPREQSRLLDVATIQEVEPVEEITGSSEMTTGVELGCLDSVEDGIETAEFVEVIKVAEAGQVNEAAAAGALTAAPETPQVPVGEDLDLGYLALYDEPVAAAWGSREVEIQKAPRSAAPAPTIEAVAAEVIAHAGDPALAQVTAQVINHVDAVQVAALEPVDAVGDIVVEPLEALKARIATEFGSKEAWVAEEPSEPGVIAAEYTGIASLASNELSPPARDEVALLPAPAGLERPKSTPTSCPTSSCLDSHRKTMGLFSLRTFSRRVPDASRRSSATSASKARSFMFIQGRSSRSTNLSPPLASNPLA